VEHHTTIHEAGEGGAEAVCSCGWRSPVFGPVAKTACKAEDASHSGYENLIMPITCPELALSRRLRRS
jgi:hypothetical protein